MSAMISKRRVTADLFIQIVLLSIMLLMIYRSELPAEARGFVPFFYSIFLGGWWLAPMLFLMLWQFTYNFRLNKYFEYPFRILLNKTLLIISTIWLAAMIIAGDMGIIVSNIMLLTVILSGFLLSIRDFANRYFWPKPFWQL